MFTRRYYIRIKYLLVETPMNFYTAYLDEISKRKKRDLEAEPIADGDLTTEIISLIKNTQHEKREAALGFFIYNILPGSTSAADVKAKFLKKNNSWSIRC